MNADRNGEPGIEAAAPARLAGRFELLERLGQGAHGTVHRARDLETGDIVALKHLGIVDAESVYRFKREFRLLADLTHPNLVSLHDLWIDGGDCVFTMELVEGPDLSTWIAGPTAAADPAAFPRVLPVIAQVVDGIGALHAAGIVHRDIKPTNVRVAQEADGGARAVLLDLGLGLIASPDDRDSGESSQFAGTFVYMSPEQVWGGRATPASDWYTLATVLFEAFAARLPFEGNAAAQAAAKRYRPALSLRDAAPGLPGAFADLIDAMLDPDPGRRPDQEHIAGVLDLLGQARGRSRLRTAAASSRRDSRWERTGDQDPFVGRDEELARLDEAWSGSGPRLVKVRGESGIGKTELLRRWLDATEAASDAMVLRGRCHPHEIVPRKGLDQVMDDLSRVLQSENGIGGDLDPAAASALVRLFPVLGRVASLAAAGARHTNADADVDYLLRTGASALATVMEAFAGRGVIVWIDDAQWGDADSARFVSSWLSSRSADILWILSFRPEGEANSPLVVSLSDLASFRNSTTTMDVSPLTASVSLELATLLLGQTGRHDDRAVSRLAEEAGGSPFFLGELARVATDEPGGERGATRLSEVILRRVAAAGTEAAQLLRVACVAGAPLAQSTLLEACGLGGSGVRVLGDLERRCLLRVLEGPEQRLVQAYHDRIAEEVQRALAPEEGRSVHLRLADALATEGQVDAERLVFHLSGAGQFRRAAPHAVVAADRAAESLAFHRAAELYRFALQHGEETVDARRLRIGLAESLANAGRGEDAAAAFEDAADHITDAEVDDIDVLDLRRRAAEQQLRNGRIDAGIDGMRRVLKEFGERLPDRPLEAIPSFAWQRLRVALRGFHYEKRAFESASPRNIARMNAMWATSVSVSMVNPTLSAALQTRHLIAALSEGDTRRVSLVLANEATWRASLGGERFLARARQALDDSRALAEEGGEPYPLAWSHMAEGMVGWHRGRFADGIAPLDRAAELYATRCRGAFFEVALTNVYRFSCLALAGRLDRLRLLVETGAREAEERGDLFALHACLAGESVLAWLTTDEAAPLQSRIDDAIRHWPTDAFLTQHYHHLTAAVQLDLHRGDGEGGHRRIESQWGRLRRSGFLGFESAGLGLHFLRGRAAAAALADAPPASRARLLATVERAARRLERSRLVFAAPCALVLRAAAAFHRSGPAAAGGILSRAAAGFDAAAMPLHAFSSRDQLRLLGEEPAPVSSEGVGSQRWQAPERLAFVLAPVVKPGP
ncbi:MAG: serine/threonine-protein kinase PknK [Candidatus Binatia bacterium]